MSIWPLKLPTSGVVGIDLSNASPAELAQSKRLLFELENKNSVVRGDLAPEDLRSSLAQLLLGRPTLVLRSSTFLSKPTSTSQHNLGKIANFEKELRDFFVKEGVGLCPTCGEKITPNSAARWLSEWRENFAGSVGCAVLHLETNSRQLSDSFKDRVSLADLGFNGLSEMYASELFLIRAKSIAGKNTEERLLRLSEIEREGLGIEDLLGIVVATIGLSDSERFDPAIFLSQLSGYLEHDCRLYCFQSGRRAKLAGPCYVSHYECAVCCRLLESSEILDWEIYSVDQKRSLALSQASTRTLAQLITEPILEPSLLRPRLKAWEQAGFGDLKLSDTICSSGERVRAILAELAYMPLSELVIIYDGVLDIFTAAEREQILKLLDQLVARELQIHIVISYNINSKDKNTEERSKEFAYDAKRRIENLTLIQGPSGSGKTRFLIEASSSDPNGYLLGYQSSKFSSPAKEHESLASRVGFISVVSSLYCRQFESRIRGYGAQEFDPHISSMRCTECKGTGLDADPISRLFKAQGSFYSACSYCAGQRFGADFLAQMQRVKVCGLSMPELLQTKVVDLLQLMAPEPECYSILYHLSELGFAAYVLGSSLVNFSPAEMGRLELLELQMQLTSGKKRAGKDIKARKASKNAKPTLCLDYPLIGLSRVEREQYLALLSNYALQCQQIIISDNSESCLGIAASVVSFSHGD